MTQAEADLRYEEALADSQIKQAEANLASATAQVAQGEADLENARLTFERETELSQKGVESAQAYDVARTTRRQRESPAGGAPQTGRGGARRRWRSARANAEQVAVRRAAAGGRPPSAGGGPGPGGEGEGAARLHGDPRPDAADRGRAGGAAGRGGEPGAGDRDAWSIPDDLWVRVDVEESYIDRIRLGETVTVRLPSGAEREGTVFFRGVDADYATQRDVSRTKRDIKTFEVRLRCDNRDRALAVGMTAYVTLPLANRDRPMPDVEVDQLTKCFGDFCAVDALSFTVNHGEVFGLLGPERRRASRR